MPHCLDLTFGCFFLLLLLAVDPSYAFSSTSGIYRLTLSPATGRARKRPICRAGYKWFPSSDQQSKLVEDADISNISRTLQQETAVVEGMGDLVDSLQIDEIGDNEKERTWLLTAVGAIFLAATAAVASVAGVRPQDLLDGVDHFFQNPAGALEEVSMSVSSMGVLAPLYFGFFYTIAEVLAIPATPLTMSAGYLFGVPQGTLVVLISANIAASISFFVGKTILRETVENMLEDFPQFQKIDRAVGKEGFKLMLLLRLSPIFPFALANYLYGASSIRFSAYFWGTLLGFAPGTLAYVYTGYVGKALTVGGDGSQPWYVYGAGLALFAGIMKSLADVATGIVEELDDEE